jgi:hypothetical protein
MKIILISASLLFSVQSFAQTGDTVQYIDCHFDDISMEDRVIVSLTDANTGTFFYSTGLDSEGNDRRTGAEKMKRIADVASQPEMAQFEATSVVDDYGTPKTIKFGFSMPKNLIFKSTNDLHAFVTSSTGYAEGLNCFARIYPKN